MIDCMCTFAIFQSKLTKSPFHPSSQIMVDHCCLDDFPSVRNGYRLENLARFRARFRALSVLKVATAVCAILIRLLNVLFVASVAMRPQPVLSLVCADAVVGPAIWPGSKPRRGAFQFLFLPWIHPLNPLFHLTVLAGASPAADCVIFFAPMLALIHLYYLLLLPLLTLPLCLLLLFLLLFVFYCFCPCQVSCWYRDLCWSPRLYWRAFPFSGFY